MYRKVEEAVGIETNGLQLSDIPVLPFRQLRQTDSELFGKAFCATISTRAFTASKGGTPAVTDVTLFRNAQSCASSVSSKSWNDTLLQNILRFSPFSLTVFKNERANLPEHLRPAAQSFKHCFSSSEIGLFVTIRYLCFLVSFICDTKSVSSCTIITAHLLQSTCGHTFSK